MTNSRLVSHVISFLDLEAHGENYAEEALSLGYQRLAEDKSPYLYKLDCDLIASGQGEAISQLERRLLLNFEDSLGESEGNEYLAEVRFVGSVDSNESIFLQLFDNLNNTEAFRHVFDKLAANLGLSPEQLVSMMKREVLSKTQEQRKSRLKSPNLHVQFLKHFMTQLDELVAKTHNLEDITYRDVLSEELRGLFQEAHYCFLYGLESSSAVMCGAILEEAFRKRFGYGSATKLNLDDIFFNALNEGVISQEAFAMADEIKKMRNLAAHNPKKFKMQSDAIKATILTNTRSVVKELLAGRSEMG